MNHVKYVSSHDPPDSSFITEHKFSALEGECAVTFCLFGSGPTGSLESCKSACVCMWVYDSVCVYVCVCVCERVCACVYV